MTSDALAAPNDVTVPPTPWRENPEIVAEIEALRVTYSAPDLCVPAVLCDNHPQDAVAFTIVDTDLNVSELTYGSLQERSRRLATALAAKGIGRGDYVGVLMAKGEQMAVVFLALTRLGAIYIPLFTAFAGPAIDSRVSAAGAKLIVSDADQLAKLEGIDIPTLTSGAGIEDLIAASEPLEEDVRIGGDGIMAMLFTSGTTGAPKGVPVPAFAMAAFTSYMVYGFDVRDDDVFWNGADPGWAYGLYYALIGPLAIGRPNILSMAHFSSAVTKAIVDKLGVTNFASAPTVYRALKRDGVTFAKPLRTASSAGEPLTPDVITWAPEALGADVRDQWGQTEHGMAIANSWEERLKRDIQPGSMGQALPGYVAGILDNTLVLSSSESPLYWFPGYFNAPEKTAERYTEDHSWYLTGDAGRVEGVDFFFASREDDLVIASGYRISPFDIESIIARDDAVAEAAVVGRRYENAVSGEVIEAFVVLVDGAETDGVEARLQQLVRDGYGAHAYPRKVHIVDELPKTPSGKVRRVELRQVPQA